jgi:hypothetical protein
LLRGKTAVVVDAFPGIGRAPASAGPRRLAPLRARPALGVSVGKQQSHYCDAEQNKTDRAHDCPPLSFNTDAYYRLANVIDPATNSNSVNDLAR